MKVSRYVPKPLLPYYSYLRFSASCLAADLAGLARSPVTSIPLPRARLRYRVHGDVSPARFLAVGETCSEDILRNLARLDVTLTESCRILDWGCGCGRILRHLMKRVASKQIYGCDIDKDLVRWCSENLQGAQFVVASEKPPLMYPADFFDLIYGISVMTHLDEDRQLRWLDELHRIARPGAIVMLSVHGAQDHTHLDGGEREALKKDGICFKRVYPDKLRLDGLPDYYQATFHAKEYIEKIWTKAFSLRLYVEQGVNNHQDLVILQKPADGAV